MRLKLPAVTAAFLCVPLGAQDGDRVRELNEVDAPPAALNLQEFSAALAARYPPALWDSAIGGSVMVEFVIGADGTVRDAAVVEASRQELGAATVEAVGVLRFRPATVAGGAVAVRVTQPVEWRVDVNAAAQAPPPRPLPAELQARVDADPALAALVRRAGEEGARADEPPLLRNPRRLARATAREHRRLFRGSEARGAVTVRFLVDPEGVPRLPYVVAADDPRFRDPALRIVLRLRFDPARAGGVAVPFWLELPIEWAASL